MSGEDSSSPANEATGLDASQGTTPQQWERIKVFLRELPSSDSISRSANTIEKETQLVKEFLSQAFPLPQLFLALDEATRQNNRERVGQASKAILRVFTSSIGPALLDDPVVLPNLNAGLQHPDSEVRKLTTRVLQRGLEQRPKDDAFLGLLLASGVAASLATGVADDDIGVSQHASDALVELVRQAAALATPGADDDRQRTVMGLIRDAASSERVAGSSVFPLRFAELLARAMASSEDAMAVAVSTGASECLFRLLDGRDVLIQFSALELLDPLAQTPWGAAHLFERGSVAKLLTMATGKDDVLSTRPGREPDPILGGTSLRVLGSVYRTMFSESRREEEAGGSEEARRRSLDPQLVRAVLSTVMQYAESNRDADRLSALQAICGFAVGSPVALRLILDDPVLVSAWLDLRSMRTEMKAASLHSVARVLRGGKEQKDEAAAAASAETQVPPAATAAPVPGSGGEEEEAELRKLLFNRLGEVNTRAANSTMAFLIGHLKAPIQPLRDAVYDIMGAVAVQRTGWGLRALFGHGGFLEMLLNRRTETTKEGREWKYTVVESAMRCPDRAILGQELLDKLTTHLKQGPFYVDAGTQAEVDTVT